MAFDATGYKDRFDFLGEADLVIGRRGQLRGLLRGDGCLERGAAGEPGGQNQFGEAESHPTLNVLESRQKYREKVKRET
jgi:hypothetical protein